MKLEDKTVAELKDMLREHNLPVSGSKAQLIHRLQENSAQDAVLSLEAVSYTHLTLPTNTPV